MVRVGVLDSKRMKSEGADSPSCCASNGKEKGEDRDENVAPLQWNGQDDLADALL